MVVDNANKRGIQAWTSANWRVLDLDLNWASVIKESLTHEGGQREPDQDDLEWLPRSIRGQYGITLTLVRKILSQDTPNSPYRE